MKNLIFFLLFALTPIFVFAQEEVPANVDSLAARIGEVKSAVKIPGTDTIIVTNTDEEQFVLVGENVGSLVSTLLTGFDQIRENVSKTEGRPIDWVLELVKWLLGGSLTSVIAYGTRSINGLKDLFSKIAKNRRLVVGIAGAVAFGWLVLNGGDLTSMVFWASWGATWFAFAMFAIGLYDTVFSRFKKTEKTEDQKLEAVANAQRLIQDAGGSVSFG